ncbi:MAG: hypothetical protein CMQ15_16080 [Gammaproteobacteria bacterium]|jgi:2-polyprenyl-3-methyl-5-hydroxy-6-metoxy-1,4-benzoquinol methylase|nr:hypothetical protein [Gammaproteobacteria bacterium]|tara:strand:+ start:8771 stop:9739 length:969 start_codon:yes stop_codon:yes gene_type:complete
MDKNIVENYFNENATRWVADSYGNEEYKYPIGLHRMRITADIINENFKSKKINSIDIGCGGGNLCLLLAELGHNMTGIDLSKEMINLSKEKLSQLSPDVASRVRFMNCDFMDEGLQEEYFDAISALGVIGYQNDEDSFFNSIRRLLKPKGILIVSCRNRLFNMTSLTPYTIKEIENGSAVDLINEIEELYCSIPESMSAEFIKNIETTISVISKRPDVISNKENNAKSIKPGRSGIKFADLTSMNPSQHTPKQLTEIAKRHGLTNVGYRGVHPHLFIPKLNYLLPPKVFNALSDSLNSFEKLPVSLIWSSCFIGVFKKESNI